MENYRPRKRYSTINKARKAEGAALRKRRSRAYKEALAAGFPPALAAEAMRDPMREANVMLDEIKALPYAERQRLKAAPATERLSLANYTLVQRRCQERYDEMVERFPAARRAAADAWLQLEALF